MIVLDTNVISEFMRPEPAEQVVRWLDRIEQHEIWTASVVLAEISAGIAQLPAGARQTRLAHAFDAMREMFTEQVLDFDSAAAVEYGRVVARRSRLGRPISVVDAQLAAIGIATGGTIATRNTADFTGTNVELVDPWRG